MPIIEKKFFWPKFGQVRPKLALMYLYSTILFAELLSPIQISPYYYLRSVGPQVLLVFYNFSANILATKIEFFLTEDILSIISFWFFGAIFARR